VSVGSPLKQGSVNGAVTRLSGLRANLAWAFALFARARKSAVTPIWRAPLRLAIATAVGVAIIVVTMIVLDAPAVTAAQRAPEWMIVMFEYITVFGKSVWFLLPILLALALIACLSTKQLTRMTRGVRGEQAVRGGFVLFWVCFNGLLL